MRRTGDNNEKTFFAENAELPVLASSLDNIYKNFKLCQFIVA